MNNNNYYLRITIYWYFTLESFTFHYVGVVFRAL